MKTDAQIAQELIDDISGEFSSYSIVQLTPYIAETRLNVNEGFWVERYDLAVKLMAAHNILSAKAGGANAGAGPVASKSAGELSISYATSNNQAYTGLYSTTGWGRRYAELLQSVRFKAPLVI